MIIEGYGHEWMKSEKPALEQLINLGYDHKNRSELDKTRESDLEPLLIDRFKQTIMKINPWLDKDGVDDVLRQFQKLDGETGLDANEIMHARIVGLSTSSMRPITVVSNIDGTNKPHTVKIIDFENINNNDFLVTNQYFLKGYKDDIIPDIVIFINGIPLVVIECKSPYISNPLSEAINGNLTRYQESKTGHDSFFHYVQILITMCGIKAKYAPTFSSAYQYKEWKDPYPLPLDKQKNYRQQEVLIDGMLEKSNLLELIRNFTIFQTERNIKTKKIAKYQQFRVVQKAIQKIDVGKTCLEKGGVIWHTQGSGKSLIMLWLALKLKRSYGNPTVLVVTDRNQLDKQIYNTFTSCGFPNPIQAKNKENLKEMLENNRGKTIMTTIFKFPFFKNEKPHTVSPESCFVLVDEGHRSNHGLTSAAMRAALPNAIFFAYTGTPLIKYDKTRESFGDFVDTYKIFESEADGATLPIYYEGRFSDLYIYGKSIEDKFKEITKNTNKYTQEIIRKKYVNSAALASTPNRIKINAKTIVKHYNDHIRPNGLKAMIVAPTREAAVLYKESLDYLGAPESKIIMSTNPNDKKEWSKYKLSKNEKEMHIDRFKNRIDKETLSILIVVDMLLTGFDAPILQAMYLDQGLTYHTLLQAIARVNRPYGTKKTYGLIIDFWGITENLSKAYEIYDNADQDTNTEIKRILREFEDVYAQLKFSHAKAMSYFINMDKSDLESLIKILIPDDIRESFEHDFKKFSRYMDLVLPNPKALEYKNDYKFLARIRAAARTAFYDEILDLTLIGEKIKKLINESIGAINSIQIIPPTKIDNKRFIKLVNSYSSIITRASIIEKKARKVIIANQSKNPAYYKSLRQKLEELIEQLKNKKYDDAKTFNQLQEFIKDLLIEKPAEDFKSEIHFAIFSSLKDEFNIHESKNLTEEIFQKLKSQQVMDWIKKENIQKEMKTNIRDILRKKGIKEEYGNRIAAEIISLMKANEK